ncbi:hypothetical protein HRI_001611600 [Hibiscus trionum]|uniref:Aminotransferase-like plant mobile domain-containing protein n=1 Tax=Hibiscus trionum TaxID=183268 RepID=A0A9W7HL51_HIBTR|nr:hypothetical protein HRI_001611600 [Hibiscus trionum]
MEIDSTVDTIVEEREELMVSANGGFSTRRKAHFLKPTAISSTGKISELPQASVFPKPFIYDLKDLSEKVSFKGWRRPTQKWKTWVHSMHAKHRALWEKVGIYQAVMSSRYDIKQDKQLLLCFAEKWCPETNTMMFPWGEVTITLEDVMVCGGFSVLGQSVLSPLKCKQLVEVEERLNKGRKEATRGNCEKSTPRAWMDYFMGTGNELEHEAFLSLWLSSFVFVCSTSLTYIGSHVFPIAIHLARGNRVALAPAVLSSIYRDLNLIKDGFFGSVVAQTNELVNLYAPFQLVQVWVWERFPGLRPTPKPISPGEPRIARWNRLKGNVTDVKLAMESAGRSFQWRPYVIEIDGWSLPKFYGDKEQHVLIDSCVHLDEEIHSFARCLRGSELVGLGSVEQYVPHRVSMQFGMDQDLPGCFARCNGNPDMAWRNYSRPIRDAVLYVPPRLFESDVTSQYLDWWKQSVAAHCGAIKPILKRPRSSKKHHVSGREKVCKGNSSKEKEDKEVEAGDLVQEDTEDRLTLRELLICAKHKSVNTVTSGASESPLGAQSQPCSTKEVEALAETEANTTRCAVNMESSDEAKKYETLDNIFNRLSVGECKNMPMITAVTDKEDVEKAEYEPKQDDNVTENGNPIRESKGSDTDDVKSKPGLKDGGQSIDTTNLFTLSLELETRICRLEKRFAKLKK